MFWPSSVESPTEERGRSSTAVGMLKKECEIAAIARIQLKDTTSSKLGVKGPRAADASRHAEVMKLRNQINALPYYVKENARNSYLMDIDIQRRDLQDFQSMMVFKFEKILRTNIVNAGLDFRKFKIGGYDKGTYGKIV